MNAFVDVSFFPRDAKPLTSYRKFWAQRFGTAPFLPMSREEMTQLGWDSCDIIIVTGDAYVDHPSFGMSVIGRMLENQGFRVGIIAQPDWTSAAPIRAKGKCPWGCCLTILSAMGGAGGHRPSLLCAHTSNIPMVSLCVFTCVLYPHSVLPSWGIAVRCHRVS